MRERVKKSSKTRKAERIESLSLKKPVDITPNDFQI